MNHVDLGYGSSNVRLAGPAPQLKLKKWRMSGFGEPNYSEVHWIEAVTEW